MSQPGVVTANLVFEHHFARSLSGVTHGVNSPLSATVTDTSGNGNNGALNGFAGTTSSGYTGTGVLGDPYCIVGDGDSYVALADLGISEDKVFAYEAWFRTTSVAIGHMVRGYGVTSLATLRVNSSGLIAGQLTDDAATNVQFNGASVVDGLWHHAVMSCDGTDMTVYLDGVAGAATAMPGGTFTQTATRLMNNASGLIGSIAVARAYSGALSAAQVAQNYAAGYLWPQTWLPGSSSVPATRHVLKVGSLDVPVVI